MKNHEKSNIGLDEFEFIRALIHERAGLVIDINKKYLVETRMAELIRAEGLTGYTQLVSLARHDPGGTTAEKIVEAMTTNETYFFRDIYPFEALRKRLMGDMLARIPANRPLTIWSAACSTGQEPYSIAMMIRDYYPELFPSGVRILASDISRSALKKAREGIYSQLEVNRGLPVASLVRHFKKKS